MVADSCLEQCVMLKHWALCTEVYPGSIDLWLIVGVIGLQQWVCDIATDFVQAETTTCCLRWSWWNCMKAETPNRNYHTWLLDVSACLSVLCDHVAVEWASNHRGPHWADGLQNDFSSAYVLHFKGNKNPDSILNNSMRLETQLWR